MNRIISAKEVVLSAVYFIALMIVLSLYNRLLVLTIDHPVRAYVNWFVDLSTFTKWAFTLFLGLPIVTLIMSLFSIVPGAVKVFVFRFFPCNLFTLIVGGLLSLVNVIFLLYYIWWVMPDEYGFWIIVIGLLPISLGVLATGFSFMPPVNDDDKSLLKNVY